MSIDSVTYDRNLGTVEALSKQEWTDATASGRVALCCARCSRVFELSEFHEVNQNGLVTPAVKCDSLTCGEFARVLLASYEFEVLR